MKPNRFPVSLFLLAAMSPPLAAQQFELLRREQLPYPMHSRGPAVFADVDGDGTPDLVAVPADGGLAIARNDGSGAFTATPQPALPGAGTLVSAFHLADLDGDGDPDLVTGHYDSWRNPSPPQPVLVFRNDRGTFVETTRFALPGLLAKTLAIASTDIDGDGDRDVYLANQDQDSLLLNGGNGSFVDATASHLPAVRSAACAFGDLDGDGDLDLLGGVVLVNDGTGHFQTGCSVPGAGPLADMDGDGDLDLVYVWQSNVPVQPAELRIAPNNGNGCFGAPVSLGTNLHHSGFLVADFDGDTDADVLAAGQLFASQGGLQFTATTVVRNDPLWYLLATADIDLDGDRDVLANTDLLANDGRGRFGSLEMPAPLDTDFAFWGAAPGDLDGDGDRDLLAYGQVAVESLNDGTGTFSLGTGLDAYVTSRVRLADLDRDGDLDAVAIGQGAWWWLSQLHLHTPLVYWNPGTGLGSALPQPLGSNYWSIYAQDVAIADFDGDGWLDVFLLATGSELHTNLRNGTFAPGPAVPALGAPRRATVFDADGDGDPDVYVAQAGSPDVLLVNDGTGTFASRLLAPAQTHVSNGAAAGDVDGDGDLDLLVATESGADHLWINQGATFALRALPLVPPGRSLDALLADFDGDGDLDVVLHRDQPLYFFNDGTGAFAPAVCVAMALQPLPPASAWWMNLLPRSLHAVDIDRDGDLDLVREGQGMEVLVNRHHQLGAPLAPRSGRTYRLEVSARPGYGPPMFAIPVLALAERSPWLTVPGLGLLALDPAQAAVLAFGTIPPGGGNATFALAVPAHASFVGLQFLVQSLVGPHQPALTNLLRESVRP